MGCSPLALHCPAPVCLQVAVRGRLGLCPQPQSGRAHLGAPGAPSARCPNPNPNPNPNASPNPNLTLTKHPARQEVLDRLRHSRAAAPDAGEVQRGQRVQARPPLARRAAGAGVQSQYDQVRSHVARVSPSYLTYVFRSRSRRPTRRACPRPAPTTRVSLAAAPARPPAQVSR
jgi:hypothetical protein